MFMPLKLKPSRGITSLCYAPRYEIFESQTPDGLKSELVIRETGREDGSLYTCLAENLFGKDERSIKVQVMEVPGRPLDVKVQDVWTRSVSVTWAPPYSGNSPIAKYVVQYWRDTGGKYGQPAEYLLIVLQ
ncbi:hypothetical protein LAZ67_1007789 [Cordylochernes scorpioides]|uniref:Fibronectin type-III domain-containing protein n=1 Tax=Cordylochernes scorpioides TaxID=51811 RepID=A0ABY6JZI9_9ARAC|nr:hypothetical protein LAZ67_1007789 [Cordylochernes scorpioides]